MAKELKIITDLAGSAYKHRQRKKDPTKGLAKVRIVEKNTGCHFTTKDS